MAPKKGKKEVEQDERFQAIVLTDSFFSRFMPLTTKTPRCLLPLANVPLIEYTLEFLAKTGVNEVYVMCSSHADQIQEYLHNSKWNSKTSPFNIATIMSLESRSVGDTMRDLDNRGLITGDFLLVSGDVITNIDFNRAMSFHKHKRQTDKEHILTMILTNASPYHRTRSLVDSATFVLEKNSNRCIYYQSVPPSNLKQTSINIDPELLEDIDDDVIIRNDLIDCHIDICSPLVPQIFQDNFDYQLLRSDFVKGVLTSDLVKKTVYSYITDGIEYASRVTSFSTYDAISQDILSRWCYPLVPESNLLSHHSYSYEFNHVYKEQKILLAQNCKIGNCTCIGNNTEICDGSSVSKSIIGRNCKIGKNVTITNSYIWDDVEICDNCVINKSIIASNVKINSGVTVNNNVIGYNVVVGDYKKLPVNARLIEKPVVKKSSSLDSFIDDDEKEEEDDTKLAIDASRRPATDNYIYNDIQHSLVTIDVKDVDLVGEDGVGYLYESDFEKEEGEIEEEDDSDIESDDENIGNPSIDKMTTRMYNNFKLLNISDDSIASITNKKKKKKNRRFSSNSMVSTDFEKGEFSDEEEDFNKEAIDTITRSIENNHDLDTAVLELNTLRMSMNVSYHEVRSATVEALIKRILHFITTDTLNAKDATIKIFKTWGPLFTRQLFEPEDQVDLLLLLQSNCCNLDKSYNQIILFWSISVLYNDDIVDEDKILQWWETSESNGSDNMVQVKTATGKFIEWLQQAEEESDSE